MNFKNWMSLALFITALVRPLSLGAQDLSLLDFFSQIEGNWAVPQAEGSLDSHLKSYHLQGSHLLVREKSYSEDDKGLYLFTASQEEFSVRKNKLFIYQSFSEGLPWKELDVIELTSTKLTYQFTQQSDVVYSRVTILEILPGGKLLTAETVIIDGELKSHPKEEIFERSEDSF